MIKKSTFNKNFDTAIMKVMNCQINEVERMVFQLVPAQDGKGKESSKDFWIKNVKLKHNSIEKLKTYKETISLLSGGNSNYPLWINMIKLNYDKIQLEFSSRFRHIKTSHNQELGHPPFKIIKTIDQSSSL